MKALKVNGVFDQPTKKRLQKWLGVSQDGKIGQKTVKALQKKVGAKVDGKWGKNTTTHLQKFLNKNGASLKVDGAFDKESKKTLQRYLNKCYKLDPEPKPPAKSGKMVSVARECSWPEGTKKSVYEYPDGKPKPEYTEYLNRAYPDRSRWGKQTRAGASCDVLVGTVARIAVDGQFPRGLDEVPAYMKTERAKKLWETVSAPKPGDIIYQIYKSGNGHEVIYLGNGKVANAHYKKKTYPVIEKYSDRVKPASECKVSKIYRAK